MHCDNALFIRCFKLFVERASLTVNIDLSDVTDKYHTVLYRTVVVYEIKNRSLVFSGSRNIPTLGSTVQWETRQASFPTGTVGPRVGIFLSPLNTNDGFYLSGVQKSFLFTVTTDRHIVVRDRPTNLAFSNVTSSSVTLTWTSGYDGGAQQQFMIWQDVVVGYMGVLISFYCFCFSTQFFM